MNYAAPPTATVKGYRKFASNHPDYDYYIRVFLYDSQGAGWHVALVPSHRNYQAWESIVEKGVILSGFKVFKGTAFDADVIPVVVPPETDQLSLGI